MKVEEEYLAFVGNDCFHLWSAEEVCLVMNREGMFIS